MVYNPGYKWLCRVVMYFHMFSVVSFKVAANGSQLAAVADLELQNCPPA
jgi:hypothetical protein